MLILQNRAIKQFMRLNSICLNFAKILLLSPLCLLGACATQPGIWVKDSSTTLQLDQDKYVCLQEAQQPFGYTDGGIGWGYGGMGGYSGVQTNQELFTSCMKARGYQWHLKTPPN
jgi:hypothetical protein